MALSGVRRGLRGRDNGGNVTSVQYKSNQNCHNEPSLYNEYILIKIHKKYVTDLFKQHILIKLALLLVTSVILVVFFLFKYFFF
jgi:hypothetical protein